eukprot:CAMPEP_0170539600 /NCGR_PEP_ID=MMETSP0209-20121228/104048_1 /TAXON_ID=665100 ORGANISM="Litonotus pictus, Strain P1" /NCGR_SAMPLE_ID=MMETSP0209 /ASSEMBLY_ACC=CAM_ASM_000301 /LENGTH=649 /DNA_ID=CAMNT_0010841605 /DNA_START=48 /DNA_END=1994 /DNA_ORIENTATION=+
MPFESMKMTTVKNMLYLAKTLLNINIDEFPEEVIEQYLISLGKLTIKNSISSKSLFDKYTQSKLFKYVEFKGDLLPSSLDSAINESVAVDLGLDKSTFHEIVESHSLTHSKQNSSTKINSFNYNEQVIAHLNSHVTPYYKFLTLLEDNITSLKIVFDMFIFAVHFLNLDEAYSDLLEQAEAANNSSINNNVTSNSLKSYLTKEFNALYELWTECLKIKQDIRDKKNCLQGMANEFVKSELKEADNLRESTKQGKEKKDIEGKEVKEGDKESKENRIEKPSEDEIEIMITSKKEELFFKYAHTISEKIGFLKNYCLESGPTEFTLEKYKTKDLVADIKIVVTNEDFSISSFLDYLGLKDKKAKLLNNQLLLHNIISYLLIERLKKNGNKGSNTLSEIILFYFTLFDIEVRSISAPNNTLESYMNNLAIGVNKKTKDTLKNNFHFYFDLQKEFFLLPGTSLYYKTSLLKLLTFKPNNFHFYFDLQKEFFLLPGTSLYYKTSLLKLLTFKPKTLDFSYYSNLFSQINEDLIKQEQIVMEEVTKSISSRFTEDMSEYNSKLKAKKIKRKVMDSLMANKPKMGTSSQSLDYASSQSMHKIKSLIVLQRTFNLAVKVTVNEMLDKIRPDNFLVSSDHYLEKLSSNTSHILSKKNS